MGRLRKICRMLGFKDDDPALAKGSTKEIWTGADMMKYLIMPRFESIAAAKPAKRSTCFLKSVDWSRIRVRSFRRTGIHRLRVTKAAPAIVDFFGRWKVNGRSPMQPRYDQLAIEECVAASKEM